MSFTDTNKLNVVFKRLSGKAHTGLNSSVGTESIGSGIQTDAAFVFADTIPTDPSGSLVVQKISFEIETIGGTTYAASDYNNPAKYTLGGETSSAVAHAFRLKLPSGAPVVSTVQIVPPSYGTAYTPELYLGGTKVGIEDEVDWYLDCYSGVLFLQDKDAGSRLPTRVDAYLYTGSFVADRLASGVGSPYDIAGQTIGRIAPNETVFRVVVPRDIKLSGSGHIFKAVVPASVTNTTFLLKHNSTTIMSIAYNTTLTSITPSLSVTAPYTVSAGDILTIVAPASVDSDLADLYFTLKAVTA